MRFLGKSGLAAAVAVTALLGAFGVANANPVTVGTNCAAGQQVGVGSNPCQFNVETGAVSSATGQPVTFSGSYFTGKQADGQSWGQVLQDGSTPGTNPYLTDAITINRLNATTLTITEQTLFSGVESLGSQGNVHYADIFITNPTSTPSTNWSYGIALGGAIGGCTGSSAAVIAATCAGGQQLNGGAAAGVYKLGSGPAATVTTDASDYKTSDQVWDGRSGYYYGGDVATTNNVNNPPASGYIGFQPPTQIETGIGTNTEELTAANEGTDGLAGAISVSSVVQTEQTGANAGIGIFENIPGGVYYDLTVTLTDSLSSGADLNTLFSNFDILSGTADCSNDAIWGTVSNEGFTVPTPGALALLGFGLLAIGGLRRKAKAA